MTIESTQLPSRQDAANREPDGRLPSLDGWRAISIVMVLYWHSRQTQYFPTNLPVIIDWLLEGDLGVRCFLIISGLLITWLLIAEEGHTGRVNLKHFYLRRAFRILPVCCAFLLVVLVLQVFTSFSQPLAVWLANLTFTTNFVQGATVTAHLWSLAVEEQFYLIWPIIFVFGGLAGKWRVALTTLAVPLFLAPVVRLLAFKHFYPDSLAVLFAHFSFFKYFDSLALGCVGGFLFSRKKPLVEDIVRTRLWSGMALAVLLILMPHLFGLLHVPGRLIAASGSTMQGLGLLVLILQSLVLPRWGVYWMLNWGWVRHLGVLSYSIYIWQQLFCTNPAVLGVAQAWYFSFPGWLLITIVVAHISYFGLELPFVKLRRRFRSVA